MEQLTIEAVQEKILAAIATQKTNFEAQFSALDAKSKDAEEHQKAFEAARKRLDDIEAIVKNPNATFNHHLDVKHLADELVETDDWKKLVKDKRGTAALQLKGGFQELQRKTLITTTTIGRETPGILTYQQAPMVWSPSIPLRVRDVLPQFQTTQTGVYYVKELLFTNAASPQGAEGTAKAESSLTFDVASVTVKTIAHWIPASKQILDDWPQLRGYMDFRMLYGLKLKEEQEIMSGDGLGEHLLGIIPQATAYDTALNVANDQRLDKLRHAAYQGELADYPMDTIFIHPFDAHMIELIKDEGGGVANKGVYVVGDPITGRRVPTYWGLQVVKTKAISSGKFLVGSAALGAAIFDRMSATVDVSTEHSDYFIKNLVAIRYEERLALAVFRPASFIYGTF